MTPFAPACAAALDFAACRELLAEALSSERVPARFGRSAAQLQDTEALLFVESICDELFSAGRLLVLTGPPDGGKTFSLYALGCLGYLRHGISFRAWQLTELIELAWRDEGKQEFNDAWQYPGLLILDEADKLGITDGVARALYGGMNSRYQHCRPTAITANLDSSTLLGKYPEFADALRSRFAEWAIVKQLGKPEGLRGRK